MLFWSQNSFQTEVIKQDKILTYSVSKYFGKTEALIGTKVINSSFSLSTAIVRILNLLSSIIISFSETLLKSSVIKSSIEILKKSEALIIVSHLGSDLFSSY